MTASARLQTLLAVCSFALAATCFAEDKEIPEKPITAEERAHWAYQPPKRPEVPKVKHSAWVNNPIDAFILEKLEAEGLDPAPEADRSTLLRRLSFDLTGLPPTLEQLDAFLSDRSENAYEKLVDSLLASPQFGVRWAQHWLDLAHYADSDGFEFDQTRPNAWRYRDWVVKSLNDDMPYDQFVSLQIAGDELLPDDPQAFIATGFNRCYPDMVDANDQALRRRSALNDVTETTGLAFLGLTVGCARCHDHKFDAIRQVDFYRLQAFFTPARFRDDYPIASSEERKAFEKTLAEWEDKLARIQAQIVRIEKPVRDKLAPGLAPGALDEAVAAFNKEESERTTRDNRLIYETLVRDPRLKTKEVAKHLSEFDANEHKRLLIEQAEHQKSAPKGIPTARGVDEPGPMPAPAHFYKRGEFSPDAPTVEPAFPAVFGAPPPCITPSSESSGRRKTLAAWLVDPNHPLTTRVIVNRLWQGHFGNGVVGTSSDFGVMGEEPTHPELLDWLATELVAKSWRLKAIHKRIVMSSTYRQSSNSSQSLSADPDNLLLGRQNRRRLDGETLRDALLAVSGDLNLELGGPGVFPPLPAELKELAGKGEVWPVSKDAKDRNRRSLYVFVRRNLRYPFFEAFDRPDTNASCPKRPTTTIAPQALSLLNSELSNSAADAFAKRIENSGKVDVEAKIELAYRLALSRKPKGQEIELAKAFLDSGGRLPEFCLALMNVNEFVYID